MGTGTATAVGQGWHSSSSPSVGGDSMSFQGVRKHLLTFALAALPLLCEAHGVSRAPTPDGG